MDDVLIGIRAVHLAATTILAGTIFFQLSVGEPALRGSHAAPSTVIAVRRQQARLAWTTLAVAILSGAAWLIRVAANIGGQAVGGLPSADPAWTVLTETQFGHVSAARLSVALLLAGCLPVSARKEGPSLSRWRWLILALAAYFLGALAWTGHSGATPGPAGDLQLASDVLHLLAAGAWVGGLLPLVMVFAIARRTADPSGARLAAIAACRFSLLGIVSVAALLASGIVNTWNLVGSVPGLLDTGYGRLLLLKMFLFTAMVCTAAVNRFRLLPRLAAVDTIRQLQRNSIIEAVLGLIVIAVVGALGTNPPAVHMETQMPHLH